MSPGIKRPDKLRNPAADQMRVIFLAERDRRSEQFGRAPVHPEFDDWVYAAGQWRLSAIWFLHAGRTPENHGFRAVYNGAVSFTVDAWAPRTRVEITLSSGWDAESLRKALNCAFGTP